MTNILLKPLEKTNFYKLYCHFGLAVPLWDLLYRKRHFCKPLSPWLAKQKHSAIISILTKNINFKFTSDNANAATDDAQGPAWVCWWDGKEKLPFISEVCLSSIQKYSGCSEVIFIDKFNYHEFVTINPVIKQKFEDGIIPIQQFLDVVRVKLLQEKGGLWLDATVFLTKQLNIELNKNIYSVKSGRKTEFVSNGKWSVFLLGGPKAHPLFNFLSDSFDKYFEKYSVLIDYFLMDYLIAIAYENIAQIKISMDDIPINNPQIYFLQNHLNTEFNQLKYDEVIKSTTIHKLNWRSHIQSKDTATYFDHIANISKSS